MYIVKLGRYFNRGESNNAIEVRVTIYLYGNNLVKMIDTECVASSSNLAYMLCNYDDRMSPTDFIDQRSRSQLAYVEITLGTR